MAQGKWHDRFSIVIGAVFTGLSFAFFGMIEAISFTVGHLFATLMFSPDTDIMPKKRSGPLQFLLYPYSILFKHRGLSHSLILGTFSRIIYGLMMAALVFYVLNRMGHTEISEKDVWQSLLTFFTHYQYSHFEYKVITWIIIGMFSADLAHIFVDNVSSGLKKLWRILFH